MNNLIPIILIIIFILLTIITIILLIKYNNLVKLRIELQNIKDQISLKQKERWDLLPNFISIIRKNNLAPAYLEDLIKLKNNLYDKKNEEDKKTLNLKLEEILPKLFTELNKIKLNDDLQKIINSIQKVESDLNDSIDTHYKLCTKWNTKLSHFPENIIAKFASLD